MSLVPKHITDSHEILHEMKNNSKMECVVVESRFAGATVKDLLINKKYTLACMRDCIKRGEAPYASHVLYAHSYIVDDYIAQERALGIYAGFIWGNFASKTVVYTDLGISGGMQEGIIQAQEQNRPIEYRSMGVIPEVTPDEVLAEKNLIESQLKFLEIIKNQPISKIVDKPQ